MTKRLEQTDIIEAAEQLSVDEPTIRALIEVESKGTGFLKDGRPKILYEAHWFSKLTDRKYDVSNPFISSRYWNRSLYIGGAREHGRLEKACSLNWYAALQSCSWGLFQIMGFHYKTLGFADPQDYVDFVSLGEKEQLEVAIRFLESKGLTGALQRRAWPEFTRRYNGPGQVKVYSARLDKAYHKWAGDTGWEVGTVISHQLNPDISDQRTTRVQPGDTLWEIARDRTQAGTLSGLLAMNPQITDPNRIIVGQYIRVT